MIRIVKMHFQDEHINDFKQLFTERKDKIRHFPGCTFLELWQDQHQPGIFYTYSIWQHENDLEQYRQSPIFQDTWQTVKQWFADKPMAFSAQSFITLP